MIPQWARAHVPVQDSSSEHELRYERRVIRVATCARTARELFEMARRRSVMDLWSRRYLAQAGVCEGGKRS